MKYEYETFKEKLVQKIQEYVGTTYKIGLIIINKNNGTRQEAVTVKETCQEAAPIIYLLPYYRMYMEGEITLAECADELAEQLSAGAEWKIGFDVFDWKNVKDRILIQLINQTWNAETLCSSGVYRKFHDLAITYRILVCEKEEGRQTILVNQKLLNAWKISEQELYDCAMANLQKQEFTLLSMKQMLGDIQHGNDKSDKDDTLYVFTNKSRVHGACVMLRTQVLQTLADFNACDIYILPSSVHETLLFFDKDKKLEVKQMRQMVWEVNRSCVERCEWLSDNVYVFRRGTGSVEIA